MKVLVVDDEPTVIEPIRSFLKSLAHDPKDASSGEEAIELANTMEGLDVAIIDQHLTGQDGFATAKELKKRNPDLYLIMLTGYASIEEAVEAIRDQRFDDYLQKPLDRQRLEIALLRAKPLVKSRREAKGLREEVDALHGMIDDYKDRLLKSYRGGRVFLGSAPAFLKALNVARKAAKTDSPILIFGESGTGKEPMARFVHQESERRAGPFVAVSTWPRNLSESTLFGHEKGSFTGAVSAHPGVFELAHAGTIFFDDIPNIPLELQPNLLRVFQERSVRRIGGIIDIPVNVRIICSTNKPLDSLVRDGNFREDLFYRINVVQISLPPLRERREDIARLAVYFLKEFSRKYNLTVHINRCISICTSR